MLRGVSLIFVALLFSACSRSMPARVAEPSDQATDPAQLREEEEAKRRASAEAHADGSGAPPPRLVELKADEEAQERHPRFDARDLPPALLKSIGETPLPVLLPSARSLGDDRAYEQANFIGAPRWYSVSFSFDDGLSLELRGAAAAREHQGMSPPGPADPEEPTLSRTHGIVDLSFARFGVGYALQIECAAPLDDPRCVKDEFVRGIYESLALVESAP